MSKNEEVILNNLVKTLQEYEDECYRQMAYMNEHKFEMEREAIRYKQQAYNRSWLEVAKLLIKSKSWRSDIMAQEHIYNLQLTEKQAKILSYACDRLSRIIEGQDWTFREFMEDAWEKRCKEATGKMMDKKWNGGWNRMRIEAEILTRQIKERFWGLESGANYGIHYDEYADMIWDIYRVIRHQLWKDNPNRSNITVDSENPTSPIGKEPLAIIKRKEEIDKKPKNPLDLSDKTPQQAEAFISSLGALGYETIHLMREYRQTGKIQL